MISVPLLSLLSSLQLPPLSTNALAPCLGHAYTIRSYLSHQFSIPPFHSSPPYEHSTKQKAEFTSCFVQVLHQTWRCSLLYTKQLATGFTELLFTMVYSVQFLSELKDVTDP
ncbi:hypothetical protein L2E82_33250 [Cichorium intybus]|uniref:Uncharacterized protein n=1 Tax=Cichorium intybus TaxID=13427 RepID=A0ACB9BJQ1_CICIN|nr:hypothetical protein L2E82_33250 [Cichorium intybus]